MYFRNYLIFIVNVSSSPPSSSPTNVFVCACGWMDGPAASERIHDDGAKMPWRTQEGTMPGQEVCVYLHAVQCSCCNGMRYYAQGGGKSSAKKETANQRMENDAWHSTEHIVWSPMRNKQPLPSYSHTSTACTQFAFNSNTVPPMPPPCIRGQHPHAIPSAAEQHTKRLSTTKRYRIHLAMVEHPHAHTIRICRNSSQNTSI